MVKSLVAFLTTPFLIKFLPLIIGPFFDAEVKLEFDDEVNLHNEYDYIIGKLIVCLQFNHANAFNPVGSSPAGCVLANRLSENHKHSVLLLEEGSKFHEFAKIPGLDFLFSQTIYSKTYKSKAQEKSCFSVTNRVCLTLPYLQSKLIVALIRNVQLPLAKDLVDRAIWMKTFI